MAWCRYFLGFCRLVFAGPTVRLFLSLCLLGPVLAFSEDEVETEGETETPELAELAEIKITGNVEEMVGVATILADAASISCDDSKSAVANAMQDLTSQIKETARAYGYYDVKIKHSTVTEQACWLASVDLDIGERTTIEHVNVDIVGDARTDQGFTKGYRKLLPVVGERLLHSQYEALKK